MTQVVKAKESDAAARLHWVSLAASSDDTRYFMKVVHVVDNGDNVLLVATDGNRLHSATISKAEADHLGIEPTQDGYAGIEVRKALKTSVELGGPVGGRYPNYNRVIPEGIGGKQVDLTPGKDKGFLNESELIGFLNAYVMPVRFNPEYVRDALRMCNKVVHLWGSYKAVRFEGGGCTAVVMPMKPWDDPESMIK